MEDYGVIEQECDHIDFDVEENGKIVVEEKEVLEDKEVLEEKEVNAEKGEVNPNFIYSEKLKELNKPNKKKTNEQFLDRCKFIKKDGKQCRQRGKPSQSGGPIINGYCSYHRNKN